MAIAASQVAYSKNHGFEGDQKTRSGVITFGAYIALGEPITPALFGLSRITALRVDNVTRTGTHFVSWDTTGETQAAPGKLRVWTALSTEVAGAVSLVALSVNFKVWGY